VRGLGLGLGFAEERERRMRTQEKKKKRRERGLAMIQKRSRKSCSASIEIAVLFIRFENCQRPFSFNPFFGGKRIITTCLSAAFKMTTAAFSGLVFMDIPALSPLSLVLGS